MESQKFKIDEELRDLLPPLTEEEYKKLEENILQNGLLDPIKVWTDTKTEETYIVDGHNRYSICIKHKIPIEHWNIQYLSGHKYATKDEVIQWMIDTQLGRRNLTPIQRIAIAEKYRPLLERKAKENQGKRNDLNISADLPKRKNTRAELAKIANVSERTYDKGKKILESDNADVKRKVVAGEMKIDPAYNEIFNTNKEQFETDSTRICSKCKKELTIANFYGNRNTCTVCHNASKSPKDVYGNAIKINKEKIKGIDFEAIIKSVKDNNNISENNYDDVSMEFECNTNVFIRNMNKYIEMAETYKLDEIDNNNKNKILMSISKVEEIVNSIKNIII